MQHVQLSSAPLSTQGNQVGASAQQEVLGQTPANRQLTTQSTATPTNGSLRPRIYHPKSQCTLLLQCAFIGSNIAIIALVFVAWIHFNNFVRQNTTSNVYGTSVGLPCSARMLIWTQALFGLSIATKLSLFWILLGEFLAYYVVQRSNKGLECMLLTSVVLKMMIPFGFSFKLFWHLCGSVVLADARSCHVAWLESPLPGNPYYAEDLMKLKVADGGLLNQLQLLWLSVLFVYLVATSLFLLCVFLCTPNDAVAAGAAPQQGLGREPARQPADTAVGLPPTARRYSSETWQWLGDTALVQQQRYRRPRRLPVEDFDELPHFSFKSLVQQQPDAQEGRQTKIRPLLGHWFHRKPPAPPPMEVTTSPETQRITTLPDDSRSMTSVASAPDFHTLTTGDGIEPPARRTPGSSRLDLLAYVSGTRHEQQVDDPQHLMNRPAASSSVSHHTPSLSSEDQNTESIMQQQYEGVEPPESSESSIEEQLDQYTERLPPRANIEPMSDDASQEAPSPSNPSRRSLHAPGQAVRWERRRRSATNRAAYPRNNIAYLYQRPHSLPAELPPIRQTQSDGGNDNNQLFTRVEQQQQQQQTRRYPYIDAHLNIYNFFLFIIYSLTTITDIRSPPECCARSPDAEVDDYINTAIFNVTLCCGPQPSLCTGLQLCLTACWNRFRNCIFCKDAEGGEAKTKRHLSKKDKEILIHEALEKTSEKLTICCICFNEFQPSDILVVVPCKYRHYFHRNCARIWLRKNSTCPLCRADLAEGLDNIRRTGALKPPEATQQLRSDQLEEQSGEAQQDVAVRESLSRTPSGSSIDV